MKIITLPVGLYDTNCYIAYDETALRAVVIDPGADADKITAILSEHSLTLDKILLTHGHWDHIWAVDELMREGVEFIMHSADLPYLTHELNKPMAFPHMTAQPLKSTPTRLVADGDIIECGGFSLRVLHTPGHTPGSVCYIGENAMFTGDFLFAGSIGRYDFPGGNKDAMNASLRKLATAEGDYAIYPGHNASSTLAREKRENQFIKKAMEV